ncbi:hypothetical protein [Brevibacillus laterosporus]|uniref:hypothetical protein n=1 Tax=Brevibacillus laterosporus TaxID=1465 RepID=UPI002E23D9D8|nr:hypothetical protein [Brevibacillus laterosporus]MED1667264.1 hypothetical protein [Brevibacillus laterosporus]MED1719668.1 hypothetical protein [Brevibacillus laterosporus]
MKIKITDDQLYDAKEGVLILNGEECEYLGTERDEDSNGRASLRYFKRPSDGKIFQVYLYYIRYGYEDYGFDVSMSDNQIIEVERKEFIQYKYIPVD